MTHHPSLPIHRLSVESGLYRSPCSVDRKLVDKVFGMTYEYGYHVCGKRIVLGTIPANHTERVSGKKKEVDYANRIDSESRWFIEAVAK